MASFLGHLYGAAAVSAAAALCVDTLEWAQPERIFAFFLLGVVGGLLPDIDCGNSTPVRLIFTLLGIVTAFLVSFSFVQDVQLLELALIWGMIFLLVRFGVFAVFSHLTVHRGIWHSWLAAAFTALAATDTSYHFGGFSAWDAWLAGIFMALGYLTHLGLDEITSIDLLNRRVRRSFGTAFKPFSILSPGASLAMFLGVLLLAYLAPSGKELAAVAGRFTSLLHMGAH